ncbi:hypothetical protein [Hymenobacter sp. NBH84]|uniref:hypothetical protein n=1 Tax=Hymenobacter sp. NBH84 TaxID=2596915 RepID=UPI0016289D0B|nr:hypothetical protein [Hymenobacter sp. NBH84]
MKTFLLILTLAIFLYSPYGPSWGQLVVNAGVVLALLSFLGRGAATNRIYTEEEEE